MILWGPEIYSQISCSGSVGRPNGGKAVNADEGQL